MSNLDRVGARGLPDNHESMTKLGAEAGQIISTTIGGQNGQPKQVSSCNNSFMKQLIPNNQVNIKEGSGQVHQIPSSSSSEEVAGGSSTEVGSEAMEVMGCGAV